MLTNRLKLRRILWVFAVLLLISAISACSNKDDFIKIAFETNEGVALDQIDFNLDKDVTSLPEPTRQGYIFVGWYIDEGLTNEVDISDFLDKESIILYAKWEEEYPIYTITFDAQGGSSDKTINFEKNTIPAYYLPTKEGYVFSGWYGDLDDLSSKYIFDEVLNENITLYAKWEIRSEHVLSIIFNQNMIFEFNTNGQELPDVTTLVPNDMVNNIENYYKDDLFSYIFDPITDDLANNQTLYARLDERKYVFYEDITFGDADSIVRNNQLQAYALKDGILYSFEQTVSERNSINQAMIYKPIRSLYNSNIQGNIKSIDLIKDNLLLIELHSNEQYLGYLSKSINTYDFRFDRLKEMLKLNENEKVIQVISVDLGLLFITNEQRILFNSIGFITANYDYFGVIDVTDEFDLNENEQFDETYKLLSSSTVKTTEGRVFALTHQLANYALFSVQEDGTLFTEYSKSQVSNDDIFYLDFENNHFSYLTIKGEYFLSSIAIVDDIHEYIALGEDEYIIDFMNEVFITNKNRFIAMNNLRFLEDVTPIFIEGLNASDYKFNEAHTDLLIRTNDDKIYHFKYHFTDLTEQFEQYDFSFDDINDEYSFTMIKEDEKYYINDQLKIELFDVGFSKFVIDGPYQVGENVAIDSFESTTYDMSGYLNEYNQALKSSIKMPSNDIRLYMMIHHSKSNVVFIGTEDGKRYATYELAIEQQITEEDILKTLPNTLEIDYVLDDNNVMVELPFTVKENGKFIYLTVYTKPKDEAIEIEINYIANNLSLGQSIHYGLPGDLLQDITENISFYDYNISGIYTDEDFTKPYIPTDEVLEDLSLYVKLTKMPIYKLTTHINDDTTFTRDFKNEITISEFSTMLSIIGYYGSMNKVDDELIINGVYLDAEKTIPVDMTMIFEEDVEIWIDLSSKFMIDLIEINPFGDAIMYDRLNVYKQEQVTGELIYDYLEKIYIDEDVTVYLDHDLTEKLLLSDVLDEEIKQLYYTVHQKNGTSITVHMYDYNDNQLIESLTLSYKEGLIDFYFPMYGYKDVDVYIDDTFTNLFDGTVSPDLELYATGILDAINLTIVDVDKDITYEAKYPVNEFLDWAAVATYLTQKDSTIRYIAVYEDSELQEKAYSYKITEDATIYVKRDYPVTIEHTTIVVSGLFEQTIDAYMIRDEAINVDDIKEKILVLYTPLAYLKEVKMYSDAMMTVEIDAYDNSEVTTIYLDIIEPKSYTMTFIDAHSQEVLGTKTFKDGETYRLSTMLSNMLNIPYEFRDAYIYDAYLDLAMTEYIENDIASEDKTYYIDFRLPEIYEITYQFEHTEIDDLILLVDENDILENQLIFEQIADYYGYLVSINYNIIDQVTYEDISRTTPNKDTTVTVELIIVEYVTIEFIYDLPTGASYNEYKTFEKGSLIEDSIFFGILINDPNSYDAYFYTDEEMTDGSLTFIADQNKTIYVKVQEKN